MISTTRIFSLMLATGLASLALLQPVAALDAEAFVDRVEQVYKVMGYELSFGAATVAGDDVIVDGVAVGFVGVDQDPTEFDTELTFAGVHENDDGSYSVRQFSVPDIDTVFASEPEGRLTLTGVVAEGLWLPPAGETGAENLLRTVRHLATGPLAVSRDGETVLAYDSLDVVSEFALDDDDALESIESSVVIAGIRADLRTVAEEEPEAGAVIEALGLTTIEGEFSQLASWTSSAGNMVIDEFLLDFADLGALNFTADISGLTPAIFDKIYAMQAKSPDAMSEEAQARQMMAGMEMAQALTITGATIRYDDASLAGRLLEMFASQSGADRDSFVAGLKAALPAMIGQGGVPALVDLVVPPVSAFLDDPQSLEISVRPPTPTSLLVLGAAAANPAGLIQALGLSVRANQAVE
ncbi:hypothetical protein ACFOOL_02780 [Devosia honganensis]|uniref:DUF945 domain-containing protein n=1 Tax=Devosia honganensis TaxID=1610527 RepID=A0ABV7WWM7_9HYPH